MRYWHIAVAVIAVFGIGYFAGHNKAGSFRPAAAETKAAKAAPVKSSAPLVKSEWQAYRETREKVLKSNSELSIQYQSLLEERARQEKKLDEAMIKADPKAASAVAKLALLRQGHAAPAQGTPGKEQPKLNAPAPLTPADWKELRTARQAALHANPGLVTDSAQLATKLRTFQVVLNDAIVRADPGTATLLGKSDGNHPPARISQSGIRKNSESN